MIISDFDIFLVTCKCRFLKKTKIDYQFVLVLINFIRAPYKYKLTSYSMPKEDQPISNRTYVSEINNNIATNQTDLKAEMIDDSVIQENTIKKEEDKDNNEIDSSAEDYVYDKSSLKVDDYDEDDLDDNLNSVIDDSQTSSNNSLESIIGNKDLDNDMDSIVNGENSVDDIYSDSFNSNEDIQLEFNDDIPSIIDKENTVNDDNIKLNDTDPIESSTANDGLKVPNHVKHLEHMIDGEGLEGKELFIC